MSLAEVLEERNPLRLRASPRGLKRAVLAYPPTHSRHAGSPSHLRGCITRALPNRSP